MPAFLSHSAAHLDASPLTCQDLMPQTSTSGIQQESTRINKHVTMSCHFAIWRISHMQVGVPKKPATVAAHYFDDYWWHIQNTDWLLGGVEVQKVMGIDHITFCHFFCGTSAKKKDESWLQHAAMKRRGHRPAAPTLTMDSYGFSFAQLHHMSVGFWKKSANERWCTVLNKKLIRDLKYLM